MGRSLRKAKNKNKVIIIDFWDYFNEYLVKHSRKRLKTYKKEGFEIKKFLFKG